MHEPHSPIRGTVFDLARTSDEVRQQEFYERDGHTARTLVREPDLRVVLVVLKGGGTINEHQADETASILVMSGRICVRLRDRSIDLPVGQLLVLERGLAHSVEATEESAFLLTLGWHEKHSPSDR